MKIDLIASMPQYSNHMIPIFQALPDDLRGEIHPLCDVVEPPRARGRAAMVASWQDLHVLNAACPVIYVEHGAGQSYGGDPRTAHLPGYSASAGERHAGVIGYISPNERLAKRWPKPAVAVGCPKLDRWVGQKPGSPDSACFAWHWPCTLGPEMQSAWTHYIDGLPDIVERWQQQGFEVFGHAHPKWFGTLNGDLKSVGLTVLENEAEVFDKCAKLVVDNSSLGPEFMAIGRPVVWMNAPWYRRDIDHGGRFWEWTEAQTVVDGPEELLTLNLWDLVYNEEHEFVADGVYAYRDGTSSGRAAAFIDSLIREL